MELAQSNLSETIELRTKSLLSKVFTEEDLQRIFLQCLANVLTAHSSLIVHRDLKKENLLLVNNECVLADFGVSEVMNNLHHCNALINQGGSDTFLIAQKVTGTPLYFPPSIRHAIKQGKVDIVHDPFKSDIYSLGLIFLELALIKEGIASRGELHAIMTRPEEAYRHAQRLNINHYLLKRTQFIYQNKVFEMENILQHMLEIQEVKRISSIQLALMCQQDKLLLSKTVVPYQKLFPPKYEAIDQNKVRIIYTVKHLMYEGNYTLVDDMYLRSKHGKLYSLGPSNARECVIYDGQ